MHYTFHFWFIAALVVALFTLGKSRFAAVLAAALAFAHLANLGFWLSTTWAPMATPLTVTFDHLVAERIANRSTAVRDVLPWAVAPLVLCVIAIVRRRRWRQLLLLIPASVPVLIMSAWLLEGARTWPVDDPRWVRRYFDEWKANGADSRNGGACLQVLQLDAAYAEECRVVCDAQTAQGHFNPGVLERACQRFR